MKRRVLYGVAVLVATAASISACTASPPDSTPSPPHGTASVSAAGCPDGTSEAEGLCVAEGAEAEEAAGLVRSLFESESLGAVIVGVWRAGEPVLIGALGETLTGVPATVDMHHRTGNVGHSMVETVLLQEVEKGTLALDDTLSDYLPDLPSADEITIDMLAHEYDTANRSTLIFEPLSAILAPENAVDLG